MEHKITAITPQKRNRQRVNIFLDGEFAFGLERIVAAWLKIGYEISDEQVAQLQAEDQSEADYQQALSFLSYRPRSEVEVRKNLHDHGIPEEKVDWVIERLKLNGLVNDQSFAEVWVENRCEFRPRSRRALTFELRQRGITPETIEQTLESIDDEKLAYQAATKQLRKLGDLDWKEFRQRITRYLAQRGFSYETISDVAPRIWAEVRHKENIPGEEEAL
jgi:regulatory protein